MSTHKTERLWDETVFGIFLKDKQDVNEQKIDKFLLTPLQIYIILCIKM